MFDRQDRVRLRMSTSAPATAEETRTCQIGTACSSWATLPPAGTPANTGSSEGSVPQAPRPRAVFLSTLDQPRVSSFGGVAHYQAAYLRRSTLELP
ncbi:unnamed protein product [Ectocarpus sp. 13 AM-2016]